MKTKNFFILSIVYFAAQCMFALSQGEEIKFRITPLTICESVKDCSICLGDVKLEIETDKNLEAGKNYFVKLGKDRNGFSKIVDVLDVLDDNTGSYIYVTFDEVIYKVSEDKGGEISKKARGYKFKILLGKYFVTANDSGVAKFGIKQLDKENFEIENDQKDKGEWIKNTYAVGKLTNGTLVITDLVIDGNSFKDFIEIFRPEYKCSEKK